MAREADLVVMFVGSSSKGSFNGTTYLDTIEKEGMDRRGECVCEQAFLARARACVCVCVLGACVCGPVMCLCMYY